MKLSAHSAGPATIGRSITAAGIAVVIAVVWTATGIAQSRVDQQARAMADFSERIAAYLALTQKLTSDLPPLKRTNDPANITDREIAFGEAIRAGRAGARPGDVFTPRAARVFRRVIKNDFRSRRVHGRKVMRDEIPHFRPKVNQTYPGQWPLATFPATLLGVLPALPEGLEYRLLSEALILRDVRANVIVDFILDVF